MTSIVKVSDKQIETSYDGFDLYWDKQDRLLYSSPKGLARWLDCDPKTVKRVAGTLKVGKEAETLTEQGLRTGTLFTSSEVVSILESIATSERIKPQTRKNAQSRLSLLATLGNELGGMLAVAPEEIAKEAINRLSTADQVESVQSHLTQHQKYLKGYHGLHGELKLRGAEKVHHATINKHNNELVGVRPGYRDVMSEREKDEMTLIQLVEKMKLEDTKTSNAWQAVNVCKSAGSQAKTALKGILR